MKLAGVVLLSALAACAPAILTPAPGTYGPCGVSWHQCQDKSCCLENWTCGGPQPGLFVTCAADSCCDENDTPGLGGAHRTMKKRPL